MRWLNIAFCDILSITISLSTLKVNSENSFNANRKDNILKYIIFLKFQFDMTCNLLFVFVFVFWWPYVYIATYFLTSSGSFHLPISARMMLLTVRLDFVLESVISNLFLFWITRPLNFHSERKIPTSMLSWPHVSIMLLPV